MPIDRPFHLYNTLTRNVERLQPARPGQLKFYACGPTVYSYAHIGNFRSFLTADLIVRTARALGWNVRFISNITDVGHLSDDDYADSQGEDKMERALRSKEDERFPTIWDLARYYADTFLHDWRELNLVRPDVQPRATEHVAQQVEAIAKLIERGCAYETNLGVYFSVATYPNYGRLSGNVSAKDLAGEREVVLDSAKRDPRDFALWKKDAKHLMRWFSPWGWGFPGWHIECSAMAMEYLGTEIDLHSGGVDNKFPHHECEIAQSESLTGTRFVRHWVHAGYLQVAGEKMSKSRGNYYTVRDLIYGGRQPGPYQLHPLALRYALSSSRYREPTNFTLDHAKASAKIVDRIHEAHQIAKVAAKHGRSGEDNVGSELSALYDEILGAMCSDLNTSSAYALVIQGSSLLHKLGHKLSGAAADSAVSWFARVNRLLGIIEQESPDSVCQESVAADDPLDAEVEQLIRERRQARLSRDFARGDELRDRLAMLGIELRDTPDGTTWRRVRRGDRGE